MEASLKCILLVEDDTQLAAQIKQFLASQGYEVDCVVDGHEAINRVRKAPPQCIILDALIPKMSGFQCARLLKFDEKLKKIPILMLTVLNRPADREKSKEVGVDLFLTKPFSQEGLLKAIQQLIGGFSP